MVSISDAEENMKNLVLVTVVSMIALVFTGCLGAPKRSETSQDRSVANAKPSSMQKEGEPIADGNSKGGRGAQEKKQKVSLDKADQSQNATEKPITRKIIRNANIQLETSAPDEGQKKITAIAESKKGFVVTSRKTSSDIRNRSRETVSMTIRIPAAVFNESLEEIRKTGSRVLDESVTGRDVTEEFIDITARLKTKKALEQQFLEIMKRSKSVQDALNVQRQLANVRGEIERIEGRKRFLENQASLSTIKITLQTPTAISASSTGFFYELKEAISDGFEGALTFILYLVRILIAIIPFLLFIVLPVFLVLRYLWKKYMAKRAARKIIEEELEGE